MSSRGRAIDLSSTRDVSPENKSATPLRPGAPTTTNSVAIELSSCDESSSREGHDLIAMSRRTTAAGSAAARSLSSPTAPGLNTEKVKGSAAVNDWDLIDDNAQVDAYADDNVRASKADADGVRRSLIPAKLMPTLLSGFTNGSILFVFCCVFSSMIFGQNPALQAPPHSSLRPCALRPASATALRLVCRARWQSASVSSPSPPSSAASSSAAAPSSPA
jgi:hypothetical protein